MEEKYCQSCGMPMGESNELYGTEADGSKSRDYCQYCYQGGSFTNDWSMEQMIEFCVPHMASPDTGMTEDKAREFMQHSFPSMKRWQKN